MRGNLPEGWRIDSVMSVFSVVSGKTPSTKVEKYWKDGDIEWITPADMSDVNEHVYLVESSRKVSKSALMETGLNLVPKDTIILSTRAPVGTLALSSKEMTFNQGCHGLINRDPSLYDTRYFYYYLLGKRWDLQNQSGGSTFKELSKERLNSFPLLIPPLAEQRRIAGILTAADSAIEDAGKAVFESQRIKTGLMQRLIPRDTENLPEGWKQSPLGHCSEIVMGQSPKSESYNRDGIGVPLINGPTEYGSKYPSPLQWTTMGSKLCEPGDILFCVRASVGKMNVADRSYCIGRGIAAIRGKMNITDTPFLRLFLQSQEKIIQMSAKGTGSTFPNITSKELGKLLVPLPPLSEQRRIAEILSAADEQIALCQKRKTLLQRTKTGLMQNLLSGAAS